MNRRGLFYLVLALLCAGAMLAAGHTATAQQSDTDSVRAAIDGFHEALGTLDIGKVSEFWAHDPDIMTINPRDKTISVGWEAVRKSYEATFDFWSELKVTQKDRPNIRVNGTTAWADGITIASGKPKRGDPIAGVLNFETCVLEKRDNRWLLVSRSVWRVPQ
jgi:ketosteroid isomerase-like protein